MSPHETPVAIVVCEPAPGTIQSATGDVTGPPPRRRRLGTPSSQRQAESGDASISHTEAALLRGQPLQTQEIRRITGALLRMERNHGNTMQLVYYELQLICSHIGNLALSVRQLVGGLLTQTESARRQDRQLLNRRDRMSSSIVRLAVNTTGLSRRTVSIQVGMGHFASDMARGLGRLSHAVDLMEARQVARGTGDTPQDSEEGSTVSSVSAGDTRVLHSGSTRQGTADPPSTSHAGRARRRV
ncbi:hypothetical protein NDU88_002537 [Pleurodeles waltl]|uniref:Uncharacterized protein n=1 Tax=Pleurodeles waltl TaxID=8319 RepID=A0AAV7WPS9_PLEWA|nr:hypothetical protein NDU88_002537 [Pleurodeles waltl]